MSLDRADLQKEENRRLQAAYPAFRNNQSQPFLLYPELALKEPVGLWDNFAPASTFFPFYNTLILPLEPFTESEFFVKYYGITVDDVVKLSRERRIAPVLTATYADYPQYFDPLFREMFVPSMHRLEAALSHIRLGGTKVYDDSYLDIGNRIGGQSIDESVVDHFYWLRSFGRDPRKNLISLLSNHMARLRIAGYDDILQALANISDHNAYLSWLGLIGSLLNRPTFFSLGGWSNFDITLLRASQSVLSRFKLSAESLRIVQTTASLLGGLAVRLGYGHPANYPPFEYSMRIRDLAEVAENQRILADLNRHIQQGNVDEVLDKSLQATEVMNNLDDEISRLSKDYRIVRYTVHPAIAVLSAAGATILQSFLTRQLPGSTSTTVYLPIAVALATATLDLAVEQIRQRLDALSALITKSFVGPGNASYLIWRREERRHS